MTGGGESSRLFFTQELNLLAFADCLRIFFRFVLPAYFQKSATFIHQALKFLLLLFS